jgi:sugar lactone lactonase YvrE
MDTDRQSSAAVKTSSVELYTLEDSANPENILVDEEHGIFYFSIYPDGSIFRGTLEDPVVREWLSGGRDGRTQALGMELDGQGGLLVAGGELGLVFSYDVSTRELRAKFDTGVGGLLNDLVRTDSGDIYVTDSYRSVLWRLTAAMLRDGSGTPEEIPLAPEVDYEDGYNLNGIVTDGHDLISVNTVTGKLYRITPTPDPAERRIVEIAVEGGPLTNGDGLALRGDHVYVSRNSDHMVSDVELVGDDAGAVVAETTDPAIASPTAAQFAGHRLMVVNSQFFGGDGPPFTVLPIAPAEVVPH